MRGSPEVVLRMEATSWRMMADRSGEGMEEHAEHNTSRAAGPLLIAVGRACMAPLS